MIRVKDAQPLEGYSLRITFTNGEQRDIDVTRYISGGGIFALIHDDQTSFARCASSWARSHGRTALTSTRTCCISGYRRTPVRRHGGQLLRRSDRLHSARHE